MHARRRRIIPILLLAVIAIGASAWYLNRPAAASGALAASGTVEATTVTISPEVAGRVTEVLAAEGDAVKAGQTLVTLDDTVVNAQRSQAEAQVAVARAGVQGAEAGVAAAEANARKATAAVDAANAAVDAANAAVSAAKAAVAGAKAGYSLTSAGASSAQRSLASAQVAQARASWKGLADVYSSFPSAQRDTPAAVTAKAQRDTAKAAIATAQAQYNLVAAGSRSQQVAAAKATLDAAKAQQTAAATQVDVAKVQVTAAKAQSDAAAAQVDAANAQLAAAKAGLDGATAAVAVLDAQKARLTIVAPADGTVLARTIEPGETVTPGAALLQIGDLAHLTVTVYVPETRVGQVQIGQAVDVKVDSWPDQTFSGEVSRKADKAEFTPRNVQTADGRASTVFAVTLALAPADGKLSPGMPADVTFR